MSKILKSEKLALKAYLELPTRKLLDHQFEVEEDYIAGFVTRFLNGERFEKDIVAFSNEELDVINPIIAQNINTDDGKDLLNAVLMTRVACNIMNKYRKS